MVYTTGCSSLVAIGFARGKEEIFKSGRYLRKINDIVGHPNCQGYAYAMKQLALLPILTYAYTYTNT